MINLVNFSVTIYNQLFLFPIHNTLNENFVFDSFGWLINERDDELKENMYMWTQNLAFMLFFNDVACKQRRIHKLNLAFMFLFIDMAL